MNDRATNELAKALTNFIQQQVDVARVVEDYFENDCDFDDHVAEALQSSRVERRFEDIVGDKVSDRFEACKDDLESDFEAMAEQMVKDKFEEWVEDHELKPDGDSVKKLVRSALAELVVEILDQGGKDAPCN